MSFIARQPNGLLCRHSTVTDCITNYNMTEEDYINVCIERAKEEAKSILKDFVRDMKIVKDCFVPNNMTREEFEAILELTKMPADMCEHKTT